MKDTVFGMDAVAIRPDKDNRYGIRAASIQFGYTFPGMKPAHKEKDGFCKGKTKKGAGFLFVSCHEKVGIYPGMNCGNLIRSCPYTDQGPAYFFTCSDYMAAFLSMAFVRVMLNRFLNGYMRASSPWNLRIRGTVCFFIRAGIRLLWGIILCLQEIQISSRESD